MDTIGNNTGAQLLSFVERIERLEEEQSGLADDKKEVYGEAKGVGFDTKTIRKLISLRKMDPTQRAEAAAMLDLYNEAVRKAEAAQTAQSREDGE